MWFEPHKLSQTRGKTADVRHTTSADGPQWVANRRQGSTMATRFVTHFQITPVLTAVARRVSSGSPKTVDGI